LQREGFVVHPVRLSRRGLRLWEEWGALKELARLYRRLKPDLIHHATIKPVLYGTLAARWSGRPAVVNAITGLGFVYTATDWRSRMLRRVVDALYRWALRYPRQRIIFQNLDDRAVLEGIGAVDPTQAVLIPGSGVDVTTFSPAPEAEGSLLVVLPARLIHDKGVDEFVAAARNLQQRGVDARFALVGGLDTGNPAGIGEAQVQSWVDKGVVEWWGQVDDMRAVYQAAHVVVLPSFYREGLPKVLLEAASSGRPVVTTDSPGCRDAVSDGETGYLVPVRDSDALTERLHELLADSELRQRMGRAGRERAEREFATARVVTDTLAVYRELLGAPGRRSRLHEQGGQFE
jgi:glycosyltransferase involved in cell wall biosynthesis